MNVELARQVMRRVETLAAGDGPDFWDQNTFGYHAHCGTVACFAGWAVVLADGPETLCTGGNGVAGRAMELLGLDRDDALRIFYLRTEDPAVLRAAVEDVFGPLDTTAEPARMSS